MSWLRLLIDEARDWPQHYVFRRPVLLALVIYAVVLIALKQSGRLDAIPANDPAQWNGRRVRLTGVIREQPDPRPKATTYVIQAESLYCSDEETAVAVQGKVLAQILGAPAERLAPGDRVEIWGRLQSPSGARTPGAFDYRAYLANQNIYSAMYTGQGAVTNLGNSGTYSMIRRGWALKRRVTHIFDRRLTAPQSTVLSGLVIGTRPRFDAEIKRIFLESGTMHILVASGSNIGFVLGLWFFILRFLFRVPRRVALISAIPSLWMYATLAGGDAPIMRACVMTSVGLLAYALAREDRTYQPLALAALTLLLLSPKSLFDVGFQMSFLTVFGLIYMLPAIDPLFATWNFVARQLARLACTTLVAQLWILPITAGVFREFYPISLLSNLVILPLAALGLPFGVFLVGTEVLTRCAHLPASVSSGAGQITGYFLNSLICLTRFFADAIEKRFWLSAPTTAWALVYYMLLLCLPPCRKSLWSRLSVFVCFLMIIVIPATTPRKKIPDTLSISWLNCGRKLSVIIETPNHKTILINPGPLEPYNTVERTLMPFLTERDIKKLDVVLITRDDPKLHAALDVLRKSIPIESVIPYRNLHAGLQASWGDGVLDVLPQNERFLSEMPVLLSVGQTRALFGHLITLEAQQALVDSGVKKIDVMQARFSPRQLSNPLFEKRFHPLKLNEPDLIKAGYFHWSASTKNIDENKAGQKSAGVRPPRHAANIAARRHSE